MNSSVRPISRPGDGCAPPPHHRWLSVAHGCPLSVIGPSLLPPPALGTVCFPRTPEDFSLQTFLFVTHYLNFCSACAVTVVIFGHFNRSFTYLLTYLLAYLLTYRLHRTSTISRRIGLFLEHLKLTSAHYGILFDLMHNWIAMSGYVNRGNIMNFELIPVRCLWDNSRPLTRVGL